ncbi:MAG TPA: FkbM family methyltransferase [Patescibacteria group bacterium]|nr:FkbM family methyltransferase [Patescibacteria group bacterium]
MRTVETAYGPFTGFDQDLVTQILSTGQFWDAQIRPYLDQADPAGWAIDLGANIGWFTVYLAQRHPHVIAVEAHPTTRERLQHNVRANTAEGVVHVVGGAAYDVLTLLRIAPEAWLGWPIADLVNLDLVPNAASLAFVAGIVGDRGEILAGPIDLAVPKDAHVSLIKCDVQGADLRALRGLRSTIRRCRPLIVFEFEEGASAWHGDEWCDYEGFFSALGYRLERVRADLGDWVAWP